LQLSATRCSGITGLADDPQETVLEPTTLEAVLELALDLFGQAPTLGRELGLELRVALFDELVEEGTFRAMAFIDDPTGSRTGFLANRQPQHGRILASPLGGGWPGTLVLRATAA
jgi:hypothetical protein